MSRRGVVAGVVLLLWIAGVAALAHRELFQGQTERLAQAGRLLQPDAQFYTVVGRGDTIGFASTTTDTISGGITLSELMVTEVPRGRGLRRRQIQMNVRLTRAMALTGFTRRLGSETDTPLVVIGTVLGDTALTVETRVGTNAPYTKTIPITTPVLLPAEVPYAIALGSTPKMGKSYRFTVLDPVRLKLGEATIRVVAESLFVLSDSAEFDSTAGRWVSVHDTTVRAWRIEEPGAGTLDAWIDHSGRIVDTERPGPLALHRTAYEIAFENWKAASRRKRSAAPPVERLGRPLRAGETRAPTSRHAPSLHANTPTATRP